jgi:hypothetical protein
MRMWVWAAAVLVAMLAPPRAVASAERDGKIDPNALRAHATVLGGDALEGRAPGTRGGRLAARFLERELAEMGVAPFGDGGGFRQRVPLHATMPKAGSRLEIWSLGEAVPLELGDDYLLFTGGSQTLIPRRVPMVFVGHGIVAPEFDYNDYHDVDVRGKVVVFVSGEPESTDSEYFLGEEPSVYASVETKTRIALSRGAVGSLLVAMPRPDIDAVWERTRREYEFERLSLAYTLPEHLSAMIHPRSARRIFTDALYDFDQVVAMAASNTLRSFFLPTELRFEGRFDMRDVVADNIVGLVPGVDEALRDSYVVISAHYDHLGVGPAVADDEIYNGVVDNALGVACVLEMGARLAAADHPPLSRSVIILFTTAEEAGLLGSRFFLDHPPVPLAEMVTAINVDGLAFLDHFNDLVAIGGGLSDLGERLAVAVRHMGLDVSPPPDALWDDAAYGRGDQLAFAQVGIPSILINEGFDWHSVTRDEALHIALEWMLARYHSPQDDLLQPIEFGASARHCDAILQLVLQIANDPQAPAWKNGVPYAYERQLRRAKTR